MKLPLLAGLLSAASLVAQTAEASGAAALVAALAKRGERAAATRSLIAMGASAVPELEKVVADGVAGRVSPALPYALNCLARIGPPAVEAQDTIRAYLKEGPVEHLLVAIKAYADLAGFAPYREATGPNSYFDDTTFVNNARFRLRADTKTAAGFAVMVEAYTQEVKVNHRQRLSRDLGAHDVDALVAVVEKDIWFLRDVAAEELGRSGERARAAVPVLAKKLAAVNDSQAGFQSRVGERDVVLRDDFGERAAEALLRIEPDGAAASVAHAFLVGHAEDPEIRLDAMSQLGRKGGDPAAAVAMLRTWLARGPVHPEVFTALGALGKDAAAALPDLRRIAAGSAEPDAKLAATAVRQIERE